MVSTTKNENRSLIKIYTISFDVDNDEEKRLLASELEHDNHKESFFLVCLFCLRKLNFM